MAVIRSGFSSSKLYLSGSRDMDRPSSPMRMSNSSCDDDANQHADHHSSVETMRADISKLKDQMGKVQVLLAHLINESPAASNNIQHSSSNLVMDDPSSLISSPESMLTVQHLSETLLERHSQCLEPNVSFKINMIEFGQLMSGWVSPMRTIHNWIYLELLNGWVDLYGLREYFEAFWCQYEKSPQYLKRVQRMQSMGVDHYSAEFFCFLRKATNNQEEEDPKKQGCDFKAKIRGKDHFIHFLECSACRIGLRIAPHCKKSVECKRMKSISISKLVTDPLKATYHVGPCRFE